MDCLVTLIISQITQSALRLGTYYKSIVYMHVYMYTYVCICTTGV